MRKLLKLVVFGALLFPLGPIQAFAIEPTSDELKVVIADTITSTFTGTKDFFFFDVGGVDQLQTGTNPITGEPVTIAVPHDLFSPTIQGDFTLTTGSSVLILNEPGSGIISDVLRLDITEAAGSPVGSTHQYDLTFNFYDAGDTALPDLTSTCALSQVQCITSEETGFLQSGFGFHNGLGVGVQIRFASDVEAIPEPEIYAMMGIGLALMGFVARRRKLKEAAAA